MLITTERLLNGIENLKKALAYKYSNLSENTEDVNAQIESYVTAATSKFLNNKTKSIQQYSIVYKSRILLLCLTRVSLVTHIPFKLI